MLQQAPRAPPATPYYANIKSRTVFTSRGISRAYFFSLFPFPPRGPERKKERERERETEGSRMEKRMGGERQYRVKPGLRDMNNSGARYTALRRGSRAASRFLRRSIKSSKRADSPRIKENTCRLSINPPCFHRWMERWRKTSGKGEARAIIHSRQLLPPSPSCCVMAKTNDPLIRSARDNRGVTRTCFLLFLFFFFFFSLRLEDPVEGLSRKISRSNQASASIFQK